MRSAQTYLYTFIVLALAGMAYIPLTAFAAPFDVCSDGKPPHLATQAEANSATGGGIVAGQTYICSSDARLGVSANVGEAKQYLLSIAQGLPGTKAPPDKDHINNLNNSFAVCGAEFLKAFQKSTGINVRVTSAFRCGPNSPKEISCNRGENAAAGGATQSQHQLGLAMDVSPIPNSNTNYQKMWDFAKKNPQFGVCFPYLSGDRPHMAPSWTNSGEASKCKAQGISQKCAAASGIKDTTPTKTVTGSPWPTTNNSQVRYCSINNTLVAVLPGQTCSQYSNTSNRLPTAPTFPRMPTAPSIPTSTSAGTGSSVPTSGSTGTSGSVNTSGSTGTSGSVNTSGSVSTSGSTGTSASTQTSVSDLLNAINSTQTGTSTVSGNTQTGTTTDTGGNSQVSALDQLLAYVDETTGSTSGQSAQTATSTSVNVNENVTNTTGLLPQDAAANQNNGSVIYSTQPGPGQQTFISTDLSLSNTSAYTNDQRSIIGAILQNFRNTLEGALNYLRTRFGR